MFFFIFKIPFHKFGIVMDVTHNAEVFVIAVILAWCEVPMSVGSIVGSKEDEEVARSEKYDTIGDMRAGTPGIHDVPLIDHCARFIIAARELSDGRGIYLVILPGFIFSKLIRTDKVEATVLGVRAVEPCLVFCVPSTEL